MKIPIFKKASIALSVVLGLHITVTASAADSTNWYDRVNLGGDFRLRHEYIDQGQVDSNNQRQRIRARVKMDGKVNDDVKLVFQFATGTFETVSTNQTLDESYTNKHFDLDMAYVDWAATPNTKILAGKVKNTFFVPGGSELLWDADVTPEGLTVNWAGEPNDGHSLFVNLGQYWFEERDAEGAAPHADTLQYSAQLGMNCEMSGNKLVAGLGYHAFSAIKNHAVPTVGGAKGNTVTGGLYDNGFNLAEIFATYDFEVSSRAMQIYANYISNSDPSDENKAYLVGFTLMKLKEKGDWTLGYSYRNVERDAVIGALNDGDFANGETDSRGHRIQMQYQLASSVVGAATYLKGERNVSGYTGVTVPEGADYTRAQIDFMFKF